MYNILNPPFVPNNTAKSLPLYDYYRDTLKREVDKVTAFYQLNFYSVKNEHRLVALLNDLSTYVGLTPNRLVATVKNNLANLCRTYGINSPIVEAGVNDSGSFYNRNIPEIMLSVEYDYDIDLCYKEYKRVLPIRVISHPFSDLDLALPNGEYISDQRGPAVLTIDLTLLALQYKAWYDNESYNEEKGTRIGLHRFIYKYVITGILQTQTDIAIFNRMGNILNGRPNPKSGQRHSFHVIDLSKSFDRVNEQLLEQIKKTKMDYVTRLNSMPSMQFSSFYRSITYPSFSMTRNVKWAVVIGRMSLVEFFLDTDDLSDAGSFNEAVRKNIAQEIRFILQDHSLPIYLGKEMMERMKKIYGRLEQTQS